MSDHTQSREPIPGGIGVYGDADHAAWLADKIVALGDYAKEAAEMLRRWPAQQHAPQSSCKGDPGECKFHKACMYACGQPAPQAEVPKGADALAELIGRYKAGYLTEIGFTDAVIALTTPAEAPKGDARHRALMLAASLCQTIHAPNTWDEEDRRWKLDTDSGIYYGDTLEAALIDHWRSALQACDVDGQPTEPDPFATPAQAEVPKGADVCPHGIHYMNACGSCVPPRGTAARLATPAQAEAWNAAEIQRFQESHTAPAGAQVEPEGLTPKEAWWAGARVGLGLDPNTPRQIVAQHLQEKRKCSSNVSCGTTPSSACAGIAGSKDSAGTSTDSPIETSALSGAEGVSDEQIMRVIINACDSLNITRVHELGGKTQTICEEAGLLEIGRAVLSLQHGKPWMRQLVEAGWRAALEVHSRHGMAGWSSHREEAIYAAIAAAKDGEPK
jgi:hypothetical protein